MKDLKTTVLNLFVCFVLLLSLPVFADKATIAVAANFTKTIEKLAEPFEKKTGHQLKFAFGSTGKLYAQIMNGAPFDAFFAADESRPLKLIESGLANKHNYLVYAQGKLVLYTSKPIEYLVRQQPLETLKQQKFRHLAIANPKTAPYGEAAVSFLKSQGLFQDLASKLVNGDSIGNAFRYVATGNADIGFLALSQIVDPQSPLYKKGAYWIVPQSEYSPIQQGSIVLKRGANNKAIQDFMTYIKTPEAQKIVQNNGYAVPEK